MQRLTNAMLGDLVQGGCCTVEDIWCGQLVVCIESPGRGAYVMQLVGRVTVTL